MFNQILRQQVGFERQRIRPPHIALLKRGTSADHIVTNLSHRFLLLLSQLAPRQHFQLAIGRREPLLSIPPLAGNFFWGQAGRDLSGRFACSALWNYNLARILTYHDGAFAAPPGACSWNLAWGSGQLFRVFLIRIGIGLGLNRGVALCDFLICRQRLRIDSGRCGSD